MVMIFFIIDPKLSSTIAGHLLEVRILCGRLLLRTTWLNILEDQNY